MMEDNLYYEALAFGNNKSDGKSSVIRQLIPLGSDEGSYVDIFKKYTKYFSYCCMYTQGPISTCTFHAPGPKEQFPQDLLSEFEKDTQLMRENGPFKSDYPNSSVEWSNQPLITISRSELDNEFTNITSDNRFAKLFITQSFNITVSYKIHYMYTGEVVITSNL